MYNHFFLLCNIARGDDQYKRDSDDSAKIAVLEETLASKLAEFLDSSFPYKLHLIPSAMKSHLYKGPPTGECLPASVVGGWVSGWAQCVSEWVRSEWVSE